MTARVSGGRVTPQTVYIDGRNTKVRLEPVMWEALKDIARYQGTRRQDLLREIAAARSPDEPLSSAIRVYIVTFYREHFGERATL